jgi:predicted MFS family arabinose efflux permease
MADALVGGLASDAIGLRHTIAAGAAITCLAAILLAMSPAGKIQHADESTP